MSGENTRSVPTKLGHDGVPVAHTVLSPSSMKTHAQCKAPPHTVVPVVFVPGIMGSNLKNKTSGESVWNGNSALSLFWQWMFRSPKTRQQKLRYTDCIVNEDGAFPGASATVPDAKVAHERGWGGPIKYSYGDFLRWLDDQLSSDLCGTAAGSDKSPWADQVGGALNGAGERTQIKFKPLTAEESNQAWNKFFCPVHACGYNWLQSNGESGKDLAKRIDEIIKGWNDLDVGGHKPYRCEKVILVTHSMGGLVARAAVHPKFGNAKDKVLGIVHGELPANGAAAAYHHCRSGYDGAASIALGRNAAEVTAVFANNPGAIELLPNQQYPKGWLQAKFGSRTGMKLPNGSDPYLKLYPERNCWWRLINPNLVDPAKFYANASQGAWVQGYLASLATAQQFQYKMSEYYHPQTYIHYGADTENHQAWNQLAWGNPAEYGSIPKNLVDWKEFDGSNPVTLNYSFFDRVRMEIQRPNETQPQPQSGDGTVPSCSGEAPFTQGGSNIKQSFRLDGFDHQGAYNNERVRQATLYSICKLLQQAHEL